MEVHEDTSQKSPDEMDENKPETPVTGTDRKSLTYSSYLKVDSLLEFQKTLTPVHDEHLFIVVHQVFELWFKQIIYELDAVCKAMDVECINDINLLVITVRTSRIVRILKLMLKQFTVLETIPVTDFENLRNIFKGSELDRIEQSEKGPTLLQLVDKVVDPDLREELIEENIKTAELFETILVREKHDELVKNDNLVLLARRFGDQAKNYGFSGYRYFTSTFRSPHNAHNSEVFKSDQFKSRKAILVCHRLKYLISIASVNYR
ncbi:uncharacterized protein TRIADDRAFT_56189 [Trichoplax adhaerens]|uniref:Tryptophan 2,3-dioxygenase n=1 Tax=Trichoplax adhaerens TaxID=10228 RepID=B3RXF4_TRIAD|nr:hypothetical protein TRIADDRAFT_56189 [Trichoplax adhaerens]EDV24412.1 hypothetical protein TRIADDRAFT_56189 [Trichoplax adhaerens]|eukprot:XP_002112302.1 hypothetical protein TRIADDRAFT_56189 [Trichoplax adhaerens]